MIEPGELFSIEYGNGKSVDVKALNIREKRSLTALVLTIQQNAEGTNPFELIEEALTLCVPGVEELIDTLDEKSAMEIIGGALAGQGLNDDDKKKSE